MLETQFTEVQLPNNCIWKAHKVANTKIMKLRKTMRYCFLFYEISKELRHWLCNVLFNAGEDFCRSGLWNYIIWAPNRVA